MLGSAALAVSRQHGNTTHDDGADFAAHWVERLLPSVDALSGRVVNLNLPSAPASSWRPTVTARHGFAGFKETYRRTKAREGQRAGWKIDGTWIIPPGDTTDAALLDQGHPVVTLLQPDLNAPERLLESLVNP